MVNLNLAPCPLDGRGCLCNARQRARCQRTNDEIDATVKAVRLAILLGVAVGMGFIGGLWLMFR